MIEPDFFGCSGKLSYAETRRLAEAAGNDRCGDFASFDCEGAMVSSIDRIHRCARDWNAFARIALDHAFADAVCADAVPVQAMLSFEFGVDADEADHAACSAAFARGLAARGVHQGKCHSGLGAGVTAVTIAVVAARADRLRPSLTRGRVFLSRPIGALKLLYLSEMGVIDAGRTSDPMEPSVGEEFHDVPWSLVTDVSGHGLLGAVAQTATTHRVAIELTLSDDHAVSPDVLGIPVECLQNPSISYGLPLDGFDPRAIALATLRETAGPFVGLLEDGSDAHRLSAAGIVIGRYSAGEGRVGLAWEE